jgi:hypothetical protein
MTTCFLFMEALANHETEVFRIHVCWRTTVSGPVDAISRFRCWFTSGDARDESDALVDLRNLGV